MRSMTMPGMTVKNRMAARRAMPRRTDAHHCIFFFQEVFSMGEDFFLRLDAVMVAHAVGGAVNPVVRFDIVV